MIKEKGNTGYPGTGSGGGRNLVSAPIFMLREPVPRQVDKSRGPQGESLWNSLGGKDKLFSLYIP